MTKLEVYPRLVVFYRRMSYVGVVVALLGAVLGFMEEGTARTVIWIISGLLTTWLVMTGFVRWTHYQRLVDSTQSGGITLSRNTASTKPSSSVPSADDEPSTRSSDDSVASPSAQTLGHSEDRPLSPSQRLERLFTRAAVFGVVLALVGTAASFTFNGGVRAAMIGGLGAGGLWISVMSLVIRSRKRSVGSRRDAG
jgi:hypothetical protein